jgi:CRP/FNR family transcriptional regulator, cyclic AMP receptor protein
MPLIPDKAAFQDSLASLPLVTYQLGETVIVDGSRTGRLLILKKGNVAIVKEDIEIHVADATTLLAQNPIAALYLATILAHRLDSANHALILLKHQLQTGEPHIVVAKTVSKMEGLLAVGGASLVYAGYPFDPLA